MTRYTKLEKKKYEKAAGFEGYDIKPLQPDKVINRENPEATKQKNKRNFQPDTSINNKEANVEVNKSELSELEKKNKKKRKLYKKPEKKNDLGI
jgi:hypothetical protein